MTQKWTPRKGCKVCIYVKSMRDVKHPSLIKKQTTRGPITTDEWKAWIARFWKPHGILRRPDDIHEIAFTSPKWPALLDSLRRAEAARLAFFSGWIEDGPPTVHDQSWWTLCPSRREFRPSRPPTDAHYCSLEANEGWPPTFYPLANKKFLSVVKRARLRGLSELPLKPSWKVNSPEWVEVFADLPLGRGLDHPLIDSTRIEQNRVKRGFSPSHRSCDNTASAEEHNGDRLLVDDLSGTPPLVSELLAAGARYFRVNGTDRYCAEFTPSTDFAYASWGWSGDADATPGKRAIRNICCNNRARGALIAGGVMTERDFELLDIVPEAEAGPGVLILDRTVAHPLPLPQYTPAEAAAEAKKRAAAIKDAQQKSARTAKPSRPKSRTLAQSIKALQDAAARKDRPWITVAESPKLLAQIKRSRLARIVPEEWMKLLPHLPAEITADFGGNDHRDFAVVIPTWNKWLPSSHDDRPADEKPSRKDLVLAATPYGDWYCIRMSADNTPINTTISFWDHETTIATDQWGTSAMFADHVLDLIDHAVASEPT